MADLKSLGSLIDDMKTRKAQALVACNKLGKIWKSKLCSELKVRVFLATVESVFLYGSETWTLTKSTEKQIDGAYTRMLRTALNVSWRGHMVYIVVSYIVLSIVYARQTKDKPSQKSNVNVMNLLQNSQFSWNINFFSRSIYILLVLLP